MELSIFNLLLVLFVAWLAGFLARRVGYPSVLGELMAGILLGPALLGLLAPDAALQVLAEVGILLMMLYIGMEIDPRELGRASRAGLFAAIGGFITPFVLCYLLVVGMGGTVLAGVFVGLAAGVTSLATKSRILVDLKLLDTRIAHVMMAGALISDTLSLVVFAAVLGVAELGTMSAASLAVVAGKAILFFASAILIGMKGFPLLGKWMREWEAGRTVRFTVVLLVALLFSEMAHVAGLHGILGAFIAGLFLREHVFGHSVSRELMENVRELSIGFLAPIFFVTAGFSVSLSVFTESLGLLVAVVGLATVGKIVGTAVFYLLSGHGWREGLTIGTGMNGRGAVEIILAQIALGMGLITAELFSVLVFMAIFTTATVPALLKWTTDWLRRRGELVRSDEHRRGTLIVGAGPTARAVGRLLIQSGDVCLVDVNQENCALAEADGLRAVCGSAVDETVLAEAGAASAQRFITMTSNVAVNSLAAQLARTAFFVPDVHLLGPDQDKRRGHDELAAHLQASTLFVGPKALDDWDYRLGHNLAEPMTFRIEGEQTVLAVRNALQSFTPRLPLAVEHNGESRPFHSGLTLSDGDRVYLLQAHETPREAFDRFDRLVMHSPVLDLERSVALEDFFETAASVLAPRLGLEPGDLARRLQDREAESSTVLAPGLAIPHVVVPGMGRFDLLIARCRDGLAFPGQPEHIHAVFLLVGTTDERNFHLRALSAIAQLIQSTDFEQRWLMAEGVEALRALVVTGKRIRYRELPYGSSELS